MNGGGDGIRTHCLYIANVALYQLSYTPEEVSNFSPRPDGAGFALPAVVVVSLFVLGLELVVVVRRCHRRRRGAARGHLAGELGQTNVSDDSFRYPWLTA